MTSNVNSTVRDIAQKKVTKVTREVEDVMVRKEVRAILVKREKEAERVRLL